MASVAMLLTNPFRPDRRVLKEAGSLSKAGYKVTVISWDRTGEYPPYENIEGFEIQRVVVQSGYSVGSRQVLYIPGFWLLALKRLHQLKPDVIHCHDLDTTPVGYWYAATHRLPWVFDAHEAYPEATVELQVNQAIYRGLVWLERFMTKRASQVLTVGELIADRFRKMGGRVSVVGNYQPLPELDHSPVVTRVDLDIPVTEFVIAYIGGFNRARALLPLVKATAYIQNVTVLLLGDGPQQAEVEALLPQYPQVRYLGRVPFEQVPDYTQLTDVIYYGLVGDDLNNYYSSPNSLFNALAAGKPLITTNLGEIAQIVRNRQCGIVIDEPSPVAIAQAIEQLRPASVRRLMSQNARQAAETTYNWSAAETVLLDVYNQLLS